jgi:signal peptidase II
VHSGDSAALAEAHPGHAGLGKTSLTLTVIAVVLVLDILTKRWVVQNFGLYESVPVLGDFFRLTYTQNPGAAFGINIGEHSRAFFLVLSLVALVVLAAIHRVTPAVDRFRVFALSLVAGGAVGNVIDRIRFERGVVDFLDFGIGTYRWPVFNVADMAVSCGAILLILSFYLEGRGVEEPEAPDD